MIDGTASILIVEDNVINRLICRKILGRSGFKIDVCHNAEDALKYLEYNTPDLILLDIIMPGIDGFLLCETIKKRHELRETPIIFISAMSNEESIIKGFDCGCVDFITKPFRAQELLVRARTHLELKRAREKLMVLASVDELTGLANRRHFMERFLDEFERIKRYHCTCTVLMIDIDYFKNVNDTFGHMAGDTVLLEIAGMMKSGIRSPDVIGRIGGEEFAILLPETVIEDGKAIAARLREKIETSAIKFGKSEIHITISVGVAQSAESDTGIDDILLRADTALYKAKKEGRNRIAVQ